METKQGAFAVKLARKSLESWVRERKKIGRPECAPRFLEKSGVFATLYSYPSRDLRGCVGFPYPVMRLADAIIEAAMEASQDPRFRPLQKNELDKITVEVSVLTRPEKIRIKSPDQYPGKIVIGRDGLMIRKGFCSGLLLPQVATEYGWDQVSFLEHLCMKACLPAGAWKEKDAEISCFRSEIFCEKRPSGPVEKMSAHA